MATIESKNVADPLDGTRLVPVDSGLMLTVDPGALPVDVLRKLTTPNEHGIVSAIVTYAPGGDGWHYPAGFDSDGEIEEVSAKFLADTIADWSTPPRVVKPRNKDHNWRDNVGRK